MVMGKDFFIVCLADVDRSIAHTTKFLNFFLNKCVELNK